MSSGPRWGVWDEIDEWREEDKDDEEDRFDDVRPRKRHR